MPAWPAHPAVLPAAPRTGQAAPAGAPAGVSRTTQKLKTASASANRVGRKTPTLLLITQVKGVFYAVCLLTRVRQATGYARLALNMRPPTNKGVRAPRTASARITPPCKTRTGSRFACAMSGRVGMPTLRHAHRVLPTSTRAFLGTFRVFLARRGPKPAAKGRPAPWSVCAKLPTP